MLLPGHDTAMMICLIPPLRRRASGDGKVSRKNVSDVAKAPLRCSPGDGAKSHLSSWWTSHTYPLTDRVKPEERRRRGAPIDLDVSSQKREVFVPLANLSLDCKRLGGCVNSMVDLGGGPCMVSWKTTPSSKGGEKIGSTPEMRGHWVQKGRVWTLPPGSPKW